MGLGKTIEAGPVIAQLGMAIVLDDQLVHSDPDRIDWFQNTLRSYATTLQILVFTCRPLDYVTETEMPEPGESTADHGTVRVINLENLVVASSSR